jgi:hypothetical protein
MTDHLKPEDFTTDETVLMRYIYQTGTYDDETAAEALGWTVPWLKHNANLLKEKGILFSFEGPCKVYKVFLDGGPFDGLELEMAIIEQQKRVVFTLSMKNQQDEEVLTSYPEREIPSGYGEDKSINILIGKSTDENTAQVYVYELLTEQKSREGLHCKYVRMIASGTEIQMQALINAQLRRIAQ